MAEKDSVEDSDGPSLELPSLGFGRKKRHGDAPRAEPAATPHPATAAAPAAPPPAAEARAPRDFEDAAVTPPQTARRERRRPVLPRLEPVPAALVTGLVVGLATVGLVVASQGGCELVRGTSSCGKSGFLLLLAVLVASGLLGGALLTGFGVTDGGSTSFLAMGLVAVVLMLVLGDQLFAWWMVLAVPAVAMAAYVVSHRVTTAMVDPGGPEMHR